MLSIILRNVLLHMHMNIEDAKLRIDKLKLLGFPEFTDDFLDVLKNSLIELKCSANKAFNWDGVDGAVAYDKTLATKLEKEASSTTPARFSSRKSTHTNWKEDPNERARRIWEWWKSRVSHFPKWAEAVRLIVLVQPSSAFVERIFSQMKLILQVIGDNAVERTIEGRLFIELIPFLIKFLENNSLCIVFDCAFYKITSELTAKI